ncbi:hypothetical protein ACFVZM_01535 [Streptomyces sioyaensis]|uniref:hypothetical protein n=1 Tax=Streptomyces sioyaensis TaxID=67364 RepID=UPI00367D970E
MDKENDYKRGRQVVSAMHVQGAVASAHIATLRADGSGFAEATLGGIKLGLGLDAALVAVVALLVAAGLRTVRATRRG